MIPYDHHLLPVHLPSIEAVCDTTAGAEALPDIDVVKRKFVINLVLPSSDQAGELRLIFETVSHSFNSTFFQPPSIYPAAGSKSSY